MISDSIPIELSRVSYSPSKSTFPPEGMPIYHLDDRQFVYGYASGLIYFYGTEQPNSKKVLAMVLSSHIVQVIYMPVPQDVLRASSQQQLCCKVLSSRNNLASAPGEYQTQLKKRFLKTISGDQKGL
ncbi:hypothetical protein YC2023_093771 [Brassica napus]